MTEVISVKFNSHGKAYYFDPNGFDIKPGDTIIVETSKGLDIGECCYGPHYVTDESIIPPLRPVIRIATDEDLQIVAQNKEREKEAFEICKEKIAAHDLDMKLVDVECGFEGNKILFFFTADGRVDFRDLVKDLAAVFRTRIELRQIGVRDETKMLGGLGICGRPYCCSQFLNDFQPVSTKMAKTQSMSLNPTKISGSCGRLMCCLRYEQEAYEDLLKNIPKTGVYVKTAHGFGNVTQTNILRQKVKVRIDDDDGEGEIRVYDATEVTAVPGGRPKPGEDNQILNAIETDEDEIEFDEDPWDFQSLISDRTEEDEKTEKEYKLRKEPVKSNVRKSDKPKIQKSRDLSHPNGKPLKPLNANNTHIAKQSDNRDQNSGKQHGDQTSKGKAQYHNKNKRHYNKPKPQKDNQN